MGFINMSVERDVSREYSYEQVWDKFITGADYKRGDVVGIVDLDVMSLMPVFSIYCPPYHSCCNRSSFKSFSATVGFPILAITTPFISVVIAIKSIVTLRISSLMISNPTFVFLSYDMFEYAYIPSPLSSVNVVCE